MYARSSSSTDFAEYKETQVALITSPIVLGIALTVHPDLYHLPTLQNTEDVEAEIRQKLAVQIVPKHEPDPGLDVVEVVDRVRRRSSMRSSMLT